MPAINANIVVEQTTLTLSPTTTQIGVTVDPINLGIYTTSPTPVGGSIGQLQYNVNGAQFGGVANTSVANGNVTFTNLSNVKIDGGTNAYYLQTDGTGNLTWAAGGTPTGSGVPAGANTQIQLSDGSGSFASGAGFTFDNASNVFSTPGQAVFAGNVDSTSGIFNGDGYGLSNIAVANIVGLAVPKIENGTSNVNIPVTDGNISMSVNSTVDVVLVKTTGVEVDGTVTASAITANTGDITATVGVFNGDGGGISNIQPGNIVGLSLSQIANGTSNVEIATVDGNVDFTVGSANVARMSTTGDPYPGVLAVNGNITAQNDIESIGGNIVATAGQFVGDGGGLSNIASANIVGLTVSTISNGTSNINIVTADGNITFGVNSDDIMEISETGIDIYDINPTEGIDFLRAPNVNATLKSLAVETINYPSNGQVFKTVLGNGATASNTGGTAYGHNSSASGSNSVAIGRQSSTSGANAVSIGWLAAAKDDSTSVGYGAGTGGLVGLRITAIGQQAGIPSNLNAQSFNHGTAVGFRAGHAYQGQSTTAVGAFAGGENYDTSNDLGQNTGATAVGYRAGYDGQNEYATAIGYGAGDTNQGNYSVAVGYRAGYQNQANNSIVLNATSGALTTATTDTFVVKPVRNAGASGLPAGFQQVAYNPTTGEFVYYS